MTYVGPIYGWTTSYAMHSKLIDYMLAATEEQREHLLALLQGRLDFLGLILAVHHRGSLRMVTRISEDGEDAWIGLSMPEPLDPQRWTLLFEIHHRVLGMTPAVIFGANSIALAEELEALT